MRREKEGGGGGEGDEWSLLRIGGRAVFSTHYHGLCERLDGDKDVLQMHMVRRRRNDERRNDYRDVLWKMKMRLPK